MDIQILSAAIFSFFLFLLIKFVFFRAGKSERVFEKLSKIYILSLTGPLLFTALYIFRFGKISEALFVFLTVSLMHTLAALIWILGIFGLTETSIRMGILKLIVKEGKTGISQKQILSEFSREKIVSSRLKRFTSSGELVFNDGYYSIGKLTLLYLPALIFRLFWTLYGRKRGKIEGGKEK